MKRRQVAARYMPALLLSLFCAAFSALALAASAKETPHLEFVQEYVRELGAMENLRAAAETELKQPNANPFANMVYYSTRVRLELQTSIGMLNGMRLDPPFEWLAGQIVAFYQQKIEILDQMSGIAKEMVSGPKPGVDYGALAAKMPQLRATLDSIDESFIKLILLCYKK